MCHLTENARVQGSNLSLPTLTPDFDLTLILYVQFDWDYFDWYIELFCTWIGFYTWHWLLGGVGGLDTFGHSKKRGKKQVKDTIRW